MDNYERRYKGSGWIISNSSTFYFHLNSPQKNLLTASPEWSFTQNSLLNLCPSRKAQLQKNKINLLNIVWRFGSVKFFSSPQLRCRELKNFGSSQADFPMKARSSVIFSVNSMNSRLSAFAYLDSTGEAALKST